MPEQNDALETLLNLQLHCDQIKQSDYISRNLKGIVYGYAAAGTTSGM